MTDNDIIKALECCKSVNGQCSECPYRGNRTCIGILHKDALDLINRQQAEIERYKGVIKLLENDVHTAKAEAVKEFAERLKAIFNFGVRVYDGKCTVDGVVHNIDNLVKETTEQSTGYGSSKTEGNG